MKPSQRFYIVLFYIVCSCSSNHNENALIGTWSHVQPAPIQFTFYKDSLVVDELGLNSLNYWELKDSKLKVTKLIANGPEVDEVFVFDFKMSSKKDTIFLRKQKDSTYKFVFSKIEQN